MAIVLVLWGIFYFGYCWHKKRRIYTDAPYMIAALLALLMAVRGLIVMYGLPPDAYYGDYSARSLLAAEPFAIFLGLLAGWLLQRLVMKKWVHNRENA
jgi:hypothetical protein